MKKKSQLRYDVGEIRSSIMSEEGFLIADSVVTRTGVFVYRNADGTLRRELRHPDDILKQSSLRTLSMLPITLLHPEEKLVTSENASRLSKGTTGDKATIDGKWIKAKLKITDQSAINSVMAGLQELSLGYTTDLKEEAGEYNGERYDFRQTEVEYNHLAIVPNARAGSEARIVLDSDDAEQINETETRTDQKTKKETKMIKINLDGIQYETAPEVANALTKEKDRADKAEKNLETATSEKSGLQANFDAQKKELDDLKSKDIKKDIADAVKSRLDLITGAIPHLDKSEHDKLIGMDELEIKKAVIIANIDGIELDGKDESYINTRYEILIEDLSRKTDSDDSSIKKQGDKIAKLDKSDADKKAINQDSSRAEMVKRIESAWKPETK